jgi:hypothetical protein
MYFVSLSYFYIYVFFVYSIDMVTCCNFVFAVFIIKSRDMTVKKPEIIHMLSCVFLERILTMVYVVQSYWACFGLHPSSCMWKAKNPTTFRRLDLSPSSGGWGRTNLLSWAYFLCDVFLVRLRMKLGGILNH